MLEESVIKKNKVLRINAYMKCLFDINTAYLYFYCTRKVSAPCKCTAGLVRQDLYRMSMNK